jgi:hypothetical protein
MVGRDWLMRLTGRMDMEGLQIRKKVESVPGTLPSFPARQ